MSSDSYWENLDVNYEPKELINADNSSKDIIIIDDLFDDPDAVREQLLGLSYEPPPNPKFGVISFNAAIPDNIYQLLGFSHSLGHERTLIF